MLFRRKKEEESKPTYHIKEKQVNTILTVELL
jgi:hypothetical protein